MVQDINHMSFDQQDVYEVAKELMDIAEVLEYWEAQTPASACLADYELTTLTELLRELHAAKRELLGGYIASIHAALQRPT